MGFTDFTATTATSLPHINNLCYNEIRHLWQCGSEKHKKKGSASI